MQISKNYCNLRNARIILNSKLLSLNHNIAKCHPWKLVFWAWSHLLFLELLCYRVVIIVRRCPLRIKVIKINQEWWLSKPGWFRYLAYAETPDLIFNIGRKSILIFKYTFGFLYGLVIRFVFLSNRTIRLTFLARNSINIENLRHIPKHNGNSYHRYF